MYKYISNENIDTNHARINLLYVNHWGWMTHICVSRLTITNSDNGWSPGTCKATILTNAGKLLTGALGINFSKIWIEIYTFPLRKIHLQMLSGKWRPFGLNLLTMFCTMDIIWGVHQQVPNNTSLTLKSIIDISCAGKSINLSPLALHICVSESGQHWFR